MKRVIVIALAAMLVAVGCAGASSSPQIRSAAIATSSQAVEASAALAVTPALVPLDSVTPTANSQLMCVLQIPAQMGTDLTPMTIVYYATNSATCAQYLAKQNANATGWEAQHPATILKSVPTGKPVCSGLIGGISISVYGTGAAEFACSEMGIK